MFNDKNSPSYIRKLRMQKAFLLGLTGIIGCGIIAGYLNFHNQVVRYTQSVAYRASQEATKDYTAKLMKKNQQLFSKDYTPGKKFNK